MDRPPHVQHKQFPALGDGRGLQHQAGRLRNGHKVSNNIRVGQRYRTAGTNLPLKQWHHAAVGPQNIAKAHGGKLGIRLTVQGLDNHLRQPFGSAHDIGGIDGLVSRNHDEALHMMADGGLRRQIGAEHIVFHRLVRAVLHQGHMLVRRRVQNNLRLVCVKYLVHALLVPDGANAQNELIL